MTLTHLTPKQLAERWHMTPKTLANRRAAGTGPAYLKNGSRVLYPLAEVERYEQSSLRLRPICDSAIRSQVANSV